ncbi:MAG: ATP-dependent DNA helicase RecG [Chitinophagaceae bacterium]|nr:MAG: ATP-dependent DNA helicase RecG [Bacteroidetes bacterium OLB11]MCC6448409.1 ATP-dependent DNA helicase RecG [Chitinophagaceae bacterium]HMN33146.1 ATP-dependent DNA helicase RecG [Chitinophagaceae bacterium]
MLLNSKNSLLTPIEYLKGVGPQKGELLKKELNIHTFGDMLSVYPFRYLDRRNIVKVKNIQEGEWVQLIGKITHSEVIGVQRAKRLNAIFKDETGGLNLVWFQGISWIEKLIEQNSTFLIYGKVTLFNKFYNITHPEIEVIQQVDLEQLPSFLPVYSSTEKLKARYLSGRAYVKLVSQVFLSIRNVDIRDVLPISILNKFQLIDRFKAIKNIHFPENEEMLNKAIKRLKFEELFLHQITICKLKLNHKKTKGYIFKQVGHLFNTFYKNNLPFELTNDQKKVLREIRQDTLTSYQMNRLLQGDVGSGKTIVALLSMLLALDNGFQACLMAPTEILAQQHFDGIKKLLLPLDLEVGFLTGKTKAKERREILKKLEEGSIKIIIGTHSLIEDKVVFQNLGLSIIDEQHRFGVAQRAKLWNKNTYPPHILVMTATPIPRTLAMTSYGDLEISVIEELPPGRKPIQTIHRSEMYRAKIMDFLKTEIASGRQAYIVYPLIEESEKLDYENLYSGYEQVKQFFPSHTYNIVMVHGKQSQEEREQNMQQFIKGDAHIMVATTVIEVGVNVPNASVMIIESAERFGLAQLHQLRGRVGRGAEKSYCVLLTGFKISAIGKERIRTMVEESSGFVISEKDLELRGPGDIDGLRQSGDLDLKIADIVKDVDIMTMTRNVAIDILQNDPDLNLEEHQYLKAYLLSQKDKEIWSRIS